MENEKTSLITWDGQSKKNLFYGENTLRLLGSPEPFYIHWVKAFKDYDVVRKEPCSGDGCALCKKGEKQSARFNALVIDKADNKVKKVEFGAQVFKQICSYAKQGYNLNECDITIKREQDFHRKFPYYKVSINAEEPLGTGDQLAIEEYESKEVPVSLLVLDGDVCPEHNIKGIMIDNSCKCPTCGYVIWG